MTTRDTLRQLASRAATQADVVYDEIVDAFDDTSAIGDAPDSDTLFAISTHLDILERNIAALRTALQQTYTKS